MDFPTRFSTFFTISLLIFFSSSPSPTGATSKLVDSVCKKTEKYAIKCRLVLGTNPRTKSVEDPKVLAEIGLQLSIANAKDSLALIKEMRKKIDTKALRKCEYWYNAVVGSFGSALAELKEDALTANYDILTAGDDADACEKELMVLPVPAISARNYQVKLYSRIGFIVTNMLP